MDVGLVLQAQAVHDEGLNTIMSNMAARTEQSYGPSDKIVPFAGKTGFSKLLAEQGTAFGEKVLLSSPVHSAQIKSAPPKMNLGVIVPSDR